MKTFNEWLIENHPEIIDEAGIISSLANSKAVRSAVFAGSLLAGSLGVGTAHAADRSPGTYQTRVRTHDENGKAIKLSDKDQQRVDNMNKIRNLQSGKSNKDGSGSTIKKPSETKETTRKSKSAF